MVTLPIDLTIIHLCRDLRDVRCCVLRKTTFGPSRAGEFTNRKRSGKTVKSRKHRSFNLVSFVKNEPILRWRERWKKGTSWKTNFHNCKGIHNIKISEENKIATEEFVGIIADSPQARNQSFVAIDVGRDGPGH